MATIDKARLCVTLINTFDVPPARQQALVGMLGAAIETVMRRQPGFISASIHRSLDGTKVANYAQWRSRADFEAMLKNPECIQHMQAAGALAEGFEPVLYEVASVHD